jgi:hypothetical protein
MSPLLCLLAALAAAAPAPTPKTAGKRAQLDELVARIAKAPSDEGLRREAIQLARGLKPAPALPEEAKRRLARGAAAVKGAKDASDWVLAVDEFKAASLAAPWSGDIYYNLGVAQDKATDFDAALRSLALAELAAPGSEDVKTLRYEVEFRKEKSPEARARKDKDRIRGLEGVVFETPWTSGLGMYVKVSNGQLIHLQERREPRVCLCAEDNRCGGILYEIAECGSRVTLNGRKGEVRWNQAGARYEVAEDGETVTAKEYWLSKWDDVDHPYDTRVYKRKR